MKSKKLFDWQYLNKGNYNFYILKEKNRIKAIQGFIPNDRYDKKLGKETIFLSLWSSSETSFGAKLFYYVLKKINHQLIAGLGSSDQSFAFQKMINFRCFYFDHYFMTGFKRRKNLIHPKFFSNYKNNFKKINFTILNSKNIKFLEKKIFQYQFPKKSINYIGDEKDFIYGKYLFNYLLKKNNADFIDIYCFGIKQKFLKKAGLNNVDDYAKLGLIIPNYFEPFKKKKINLPLSFRLLKKKLPKIQFFKGDSDLDRPNIIT